MDREHGDAKGYRYIDDDDIIYPLGHKRHFQQNGRNDKTGVTDNLTETVGQVEGKH